MTNIRHFTATGFIIHNDHVLLHWHKKVKEWLPPGGHIEPNEDPMQAVIREIYEEPNLNVTVVPTHPSIQFDYPEQVHAPVTIMIEDIDDPIDGFHQHIDMIYFCRISNDNNSIPEGWILISKDEISNRKSISNGKDIAQPPPNDVTLLALQAFEIIKNDNAYC